MDKQGVTPEQMHSFLRRHYKHERFEGMNAHWPKGVTEGGSYSELVARTALERLERTGEVRISQYESVTGKAVRFDVAAVLEAA